MLRHAASWTLSLVALAALPLDAQSDPAAQAEAPAPEPARLEPTLALVGGVVHSMEPGGRPVESTILIAGDRILAVGPDLALPEGVDVLDVSGKHLVPGLIDAMVGFEAAHDALYLRAGVTLVRDIGTARMVNLASRAAQYRDAGPGPWLLAPGAPLDGEPPASPEAAILRDVSAAEALMPIVLADQPDFLSILQGLPGDVYAYVLALADEQGLGVWGPLPRAVSLERGLELGQRNFFFLDSLLPAGVDWTGVDEERRTAMARALGAAGARVVPAVSASALRILDPLGDEDSGVLELLKLLAPSYETWWLQEAQARVPLLSPEVVGRGQEIRASSDAFLLEAHAAGVQLVPGTGSPNPWLFPGLALHAELAHWVAAGLEPATVLDLATRGAADAVGQGDERGVLAAGYVADVLVVDGDPTEDLGVLLAPDVVVVRGRALDKATLDAGVESLLTAMNAERELAAAPIEVEPPPVSEGGRIVLEGSVETWAVGQRIGAERFHVERLADGRMRYAGRLVEPARQGAPQREMLVRQDLEDGELVEFSVAASDGTNELVTEGIWTAETLRLRRIVDGTPQGGVNTTNERVLAIDVGSVTTPLILARLNRERQYPVLTFHEALTPEVVFWKTEIDPGGDFQVGTPTGPFAFRIDQEGAPAIVRRVFGRGMVDTRLLSAQTRGGPGHPLSSETRAWVQARAAEAAARVEAAEAAGSTGSAGDGGGDGTGGDDTDG